MLLFNNLSKNKIGLLAIDVINSCAHEKCEIPKWNISYKKIRAMVPKLEEFINNYRTSINNNVFLTNTVPWQKEHVAPNLKELYEDPKVIYYTEDTTGFAEKFYQITPEETDTVVTKNTYDAFSNQEFVNELHMRGITYIIITGIFTDGCVLGSIAGGFSRGFNLIVPKDLIETTDSPIRQGIQQSLIHYTFPYLYGRVGSSQEILEAIMHASI